MAGTLATVSQHDVMLPSRLMNPQSSRMHRIAVLSAVVALFCLLGMTRVAAASIGDIELRSCNARAAIAGQQCEVDPGLVSTADLQLSPDGRNAYALVRGSNAVMAFARDADTGVLTRIPGAGGCVANASLGNCTVAAGELASPISLAISPDGAHLYVAALASSAVVVLDRDAVTGAIAPKAGADGCVSNGTLGACNVAAGFVYSPGGVSLSPDGRYAYVVGLQQGASPPGGVVTVFARDATTGALARSSCVSSRALAGCVGGSDAFYPNTGGGSALAMSPDGNQAYLGARFSDSLVIFDRDAASGALTLRPGAAGCFSSVALDPCTVIGSVLTAPIHTTVSADGRAVYVNAGGSAEAIDTVLTFTRDPATGTLTLKQGASGCLASDVLSDCAVINPAGLPPGNFDSKTVAISPDGLSAYITSYNWNMVLVLDRDPRTGVLSQRSGPSACVTGVVAAPCTLATGLLDTPSAVAISPDGTSVYVAEGGYLNGDGGIAGFARAVPSAVAPPPTNPAATPEQPAPAVTRAALELGRTRVTASRRGVTLRTAVHVASAGRVQQRVSPATGGRALCTRSVRAGRARSLTLACVMGPAVRASVRRHAVRVRVVTTFTPVNGTPVTSSAWATLPRRR